MNPVHVPRAASSSTTDAFVAGGASSTASSQQPQHTTDPIVTGGSVLGIKCADGVVLACDSLASYGSLARFQRVSRMHQPAADMVLAGGGEYSDFQELKRAVDGHFRREFRHQDGIRPAPRAVHQYLGRLLYQRRSRLNPLYNSVVLAGSKGRGGFLGAVDMYGTAYESEVIATGFGTLLALPLLRKAWREDMSMAEGKAVLEECLRVLFYRDCRAINSVQVAMVPNERAIAAAAAEAEKPEVTVSEMYALGGVQWQVALR